MKCPNDITIIITIFASLLYIYVNDYSQMNNNIEGFSRKSDYRKFLNSSVGKTGRFYVDCSSRVGNDCNKRELKNLDIQEDNKYSSCPIKTNLDHDIRLNDFYVKKVRCNKNNRNIVKDQIHNNISQLSLPDYHNSYDYKKIKFNPVNNVDTNHIFCYNCLLDNSTKRFFRNYDNFPQTNGPPQSNEFSH
jgi:hypothetical protein